MPNRSEPQRLVTRIELVLGKAQVRDINYYLVKEYNESLYDFKWMTTLEVGVKGLWMILEFNRRRLKTLKLHWYLIDEKALEKSLFCHYHPDME